MSQKGIKLAASIFAAMQNARQDLLRMGADKAATKSGQQDMMLGQLFQDANDAIKDRFAALAGEDTTEQKPSRWKCMLCGRNKFTKKSPHKCVGGYRKRRIKWEAI